MRETRETPLALRALQLLLDDARPEADVPWDDLALLARRHGVLIRLAGRFERLGIRPAAVFVHRVRGLAPARRPTSAFILFERWTCSARSRSLSKEEKLCCA